MQPLKLAGRMTRPNSRLPSHVLKRQQTSSRVVFADCNEYTYLEFSTVLPSFERGTKLPSNKLDQIIFSIEQKLNNETIDRVYWIVDGGDEHFQIKKFKQFYVKWKKERQAEEKVNKEQLANKDDGLELDKPYWTKLHILINHPCLEYWLLLHKAEPPIDSKTKEVKFFEYDRKMAPSPCDSLQASEEFKQAFPNWKKGDRDMLKALAENKQKRNQAIKRAKILEERIPDNLTEKNLLNYPRAQFYEFFEAESQKSWSSQDKALG